MKATFRLSRARLEAWLANKAGVEALSLPDEQSVVQALHRCLKEHDLLPGSDYSYYNCYARVTEAKGAGDDLEVIVFSRNDVAFDIACRAVAQFSN